MHLVDYFEHIVVLHSAGHVSAELTQKLVEQGGVVHTVNLAHVPHWRDAMRAVLAKVQRGQGSGVLLMSADHVPQASFWQAHDALVERLESISWDALYLGHGVPVQAEQQNMRPALIYSDAPPDEVCAMALRDGLLHELIEIMPDGGHSGPLLPGEWLTVAAWLLVSSMRASRVMAAWPPLFQPAVEPEVACLQH